MGLFDFMRNVGTDLFQDGVDEAKEVETLLVKELGDKISNLRVEHKDGTITLSGSAVDEVTKEKAVLLAGNIKGVGQVVSDNLTAPAAAVTEFYTIKPGDSLSKIAKHYYGDAMKYTALFEANREIIKHPDKIYPGQQIRIPKV